ncbi:ATP-binding protein [Streptomyces sp. NBC_01275]|uniref:ATP-binding protein n=1 Tax=Streptomyces sp. NBC_01275 TaxID=2903807 RepID=UPI00225AE814|nr:ATP-binding protein [Streptomyces sp. NBC_01275]MCX4762954.1 ATP-binding protein [Streptomyces sp. NBC_01275]
MHLDTGSCQSPTLAPADAPFALARPEALAFSFTLPAVPRSPGIARAATRTALHAHGLAAATDATVQVVSELTACACRFSATADVYVSLRYRDDALRVTLYDGHPHHAHARLGAICVLHRRVSLRVLDRVVRACRGEWGIGAGEETAGGTRMWAVLPWVGACGYLLGGRSYG